MIHDVMDRFRVLNQVTGIVLAESSEIYEVEEAALATAQTQPPQNMRLERWDEEAARWTRVADSRFGILWGHMP
jgi:hypothetical protein